MQAAELMIEDVEYTKLLVEGLTKQLNTQQDTDVVLKAGDVEIQCHRVILRSATEYFRVMFDSGLKETEASVVEIKDVDADTFTSIIQYMYSTKLTLNLNNVEPVFKAAHMLLLNCLVQKCEKFMLQHVSPSNAINFYKLAQTYSLTQLEKDAYFIMMNKLPEVIQSNGFCDLSCGDLIEYIKDDELKVPSEDGVFAAVSSWIDFDPESRKSFFDVLIEHIRLAHCTQGFLSNVVASSTLMTQLCQKYLIEAFRYQSTLGNRQQMYSPRIKPRSSFPQGYLVTLGGFDSSEQSESNVDIMYLESGWRDFREKYAIDDKYNKLKVRYNDAVITPQGILVTGGGITRKQTYLFDLKCKDCKSMSDMHQGRYWHGSVFHNDMIYVFGGKDGNNKCLNSAEMYNLGEDSWSKLPNMKKELDTPLVVSHGQFIFICGGNLPNGEKSIQMNAYNTTWSQWEQRKDMPHEVIYGAAVVLNDMVYVVGGGTRSCLRYDVQLDCWTVLTSPQRQHHCGAAAVWQGKILIFGGAVDGGLIDVVEEYEPQEDTWTYSDIKLHKPLWQHQVLVVHL